MGLIKKMFGTHVITQKNGGVRQTVMYFLEKRIKPSDFRIGKAKAQ